METSTNDLNDELINLPVFLCKYCDKLLRYPIMYVPSVGNFCGGCIKYTNYIDEGRNTEFESILSKLKVPCKYQKNGCSERVNFKELCKHEATCTFHDSVCPFVLFNECEWNDSFSNIVDHFEEHHTSSLIITEYESIKLCFHINCAYDQINLLVIKNEKFLVHIKLDRDDDKLYYIVYYIGNVEKIDHFNCTIEQQCENLRIENKGNLLPKSEFSSIFDKSRATAFSLSLLKQLFEENINTCIKIVLRNSEAFEMHDKLINCFECPICNNYMRPPIYQCLSGHSICNNCRPKLGHCPTCRSNFGSTRNYILESLSNSIRYPCLYKEFGCNRLYPVSEITQHETECNLRPYSCPLHEQMHCLWDGPYTNISSHLRTVHNDKTVYNNRSLAIIPFSCHQQYFEVRCLIAFNQIFRVCHQRHVGHQNGYWSIQFIGPKGEAQKYKYEIEILDCKNHNRSLIRRDVCQEMTNQDNMFNQCIVLPLNVISWFANNEQLTYYYKITSDVK